MPKPKTIIKRHIGRDHFDSYGYDLLGTMFSPKSVAEAVKRAKQQWYKEIHILRRKPVFAKDKFVYTVYGKY